MKVTVCVESGLPVFLVLRLAAFTKYSHITFTQRATACNLSWKMCDLSANAHIRSYKWLCAVQAPENGKRALEGGFWR